MNKRQLAAIFGFSAIALVLLLIAQVFWAINSYTQNKKETKEKVNAVLSTVAKNGNNQPFCFELFSKALIKPGEGLYLYKPAKGKTGDTIPMLFAGNGAYLKESEKNVLEKRNRVDFSYPITAEIIIKFSYRPNDSTLVKPPQDSIFGKLNQKNYREVLSGNIKIESLFNIHVLDSVLHHELANQNLDTLYSFAIIESPKKEVVYKSSQTDNSLFLNSEFINDLNSEGYFNKHYTLSLVFTENHTVGKTLWLMLLVSGVAVLLLSLIIWQFIKVIIRQRKINDMKNDFINNMTHEFNTPITNISLATESLLNNESFQTDKKTTKLITIIREQNEHIRENVDQILKTAAYEKEIMQLDKESLNISELIQSVIYEFNLILEEKGGQINFNSTNSSVFIFGNELHIIHVLQNIIDNAIKYNDGIPVINVSVHTKDSYLVVRVEDNGIGINKNDIKYIFDKFYRVPTGNIHARKGFGLGLNYVQSIIKAHKGFVKVKSVPGKGTCFELYIPELKQ